MHHFRDVCTEWVCMVDVINFLIKKDSSKSDTGPAGAGEGDLRRQ